MICLFVPVCALIRLINTGRYSFTGLMLQNGADRLESKISESNWKPQSSDVRLCPALIPLSFIKADMNIFVRIRQHYYSMTYNCASLEIKKNIEF